MMVRRKRLFVRMMAAALAVVMCFGEWCQDFEIALAEEIGDVSGNVVTEAVDEGESVSGSDSIELPDDVSDNCVQQESVSFYSDNAIMGVELASLTQPDFSSPSYNGKNPFTAVGCRRQCTWYAWGRAHERLGIELPLIHAADKWFDEAQNIYITLILVRYLRRIL